MSGPGALTGGVWVDLVGQDAAVRVLREAVAGADTLLSGGASAAMTSAWLFTGPPGSGRSNAARAFAAALLCEQQGCGRCADCRAALSGVGADVTVVVTEQSVIKVDPMRELVRQAALAPAGHRWQVIVVEDADRLNDKAADALLKSLEEPPLRTVWLLCAPTVEDVLPTIRSRCRVVALRTPPYDVVAAYLERRDGVDPGVASYAARASQGHIGRARALALEEATRNRRREVLRIPSQLVDLGSCLTCASNLLAAASEEAEPRAAEAERREIADLEAAYGVGARGSRTGGFTAALKEVQRGSHQRTKRFLRDALDRSLLDLASFYRDVIAVQLGTGAPLVNEEQRPEVDSLARAGTGAATLARLDAIFAAREALDAEVSPALALEALMITLRSPEPTPAT